MRLIATAVVLVASVTSTPHHHTRGCNPTYPLQQIISNIDHTYAGTRKVTHSDRHRIKHRIHCARLIHARGALIWYWHRAIRRWRKRIAALPPPNPFSTALASWYDTEGPGACGTGAQVGYAFASLFLPCGAEVEFCYHGCIDAVMKDHGPYVSGRSFDLNVNTRDAIGCPGLCYVRWRRVN